MELWTDSPEWISLPQGRLLWWPDAFLPEADIWLEQLQAEIPWQQHRLHLFGREHDEPRLSCWMGELAYRYSGKRREPVPWHPLVNEIRQRLQTICAQPFNGVLLNLYRHGRDSMGWHADNEPELGSNPVIASVSLGATRRFLLRHKGGERRQLLLNHGSLLVMAGEMQHYWQHALPRTAAVDSARINLTFRYLV
ncbi:alpha-ketoglutarate-dependent dioxygenase AlkB [uncultured Oceanisphaera sp.]|uniref:alpha-ketoglutarate-dependent dioxygenase AlkB family protein n=1 Tax=uncultured Oceanisphaera sp. TaxID=353858 RepID=UPI00262ADC35|nr:alpha-ketoglutarate-dependent dioxygenase AlkB [uncultured Oceanisphaera sp.]